MIQCYDIKLVAIGMKTKHKIESELDVKQVASCSLPEVGSLVKLIKDLDN